MNNSKLDEMKILYGMGKISIIMAINLGRFMAEDDTKSRDTFRLIRGSQKYVDFLKNLELTAPFNKLNKNFIGGDPWIEQQGYEVGVFRGRLLENWFFPTYELDNVSGLNELDPKLANSTFFQNEWRRWDRFKIRLTRNGFIQVKLTRKFYDESLYDLSISLLDPKKDEVKTELFKIVNQFSEPQRKSILSTLDQPLPWQLAYQIIFLFINKIKEMRFDNKRIVTLTFPKDHATSPIMDKHTVVFFKKIYNNEEKNTELHGSDIFHNAKYSRIILTLWGGTLLSRKKTNEIEFPIFSKKEIAKLNQKNLSTWNDEICLIGSERTIIYCPLSEQSMHLPFKGANGKKGIRYNDYWKCIIRGIEHLIALRSELQLVESYTTREMDFISTLTQEFTSQGISRKEKKKVGQLAKRVSNIFNMMPSIRDVLVAPSVFRASYAIEKFEHLINILGLREIEKHVQKNIEELNFFLSHYNDMVIQQNGSRLQRLAIIFGSIIGFLGIASLLKDTNELNAKLSPKSVFESFGAVCKFLWELPVLIPLLFVWILLLIMFYMFWKLIIYLRE